eukprot:TRINITY_DN8071_c0_g1_i1.p1 TRINITY_DN8071_c0_g1~~TRINITY_DN8071_c0_g1_i1.p1  ORF type:complete len:2256 (-),score=467.03 TRINITY_DN8071_c0_g1_i1:860-7627(-)
MSSDVANSPPHALSSGSSATALSPCPHSLLFANANSAVKTKETMPAAEAGAGAVCIATLAASTEDAAAAAAATVPLGEDLHGESTLTSGSVGEEAGVPGTVSEVQNATMLNVSGDSTVLDDYVTAADTLKAAACAVEESSDSSYESATDSSVATISRTLRSQIGSKSAPAVAFEIDILSSDGDDSQMVMRSRCSRSVCLPMARSLQEEDESRGGSSSSDGGSPSKEALRAMSLPRRMRQRLEEPKARSPVSLGDIEAKLSEATSRRQQFRAWLSNKAKPRRSSPLSAAAVSDSEARAQRLEAKLSAAEQKREMRELTKQQRHERQEVSRQEARSSAASRLAQRTALLERLAESKAARAELKRQERLEDERQRWAAAHDRLAQMNAQREASAKLDDERLEKFHAALLLKLAAAAQKRLARLEAERNRAGASAAHSRQVAEKVGRAREAQQTVRRESLDAKVMSARRRRAEILRTRGGCIGSVHSHSRSRKPHYHLHHGEKLSKKLTRCWRQFQKSRSTTHALAEAFVACQVSAATVATAPFETCMEAILSQSTVRVTTALLTRLESRLLLAHPSPSPAVAAPANSTPGPSASAPDADACRGTKSGKAVPASKVRKDDPKEVLELTTSPSANAQQGSSLPVGTRTSVSAASTLVPQGADQADDVAALIPASLEDTVAGNEGLPSSLPAQQAIATVLPPLAGSPAPSAACLTSEPTSATPSALISSNMPFPKDISHLLLRIHPSLGPKRASTPSAARGTAAGGRGRGVGQASRSNLSPASSRAALSDSGSRETKQMKNQAAAQVLSPSNLNNPSTTLSTSLNPGAGSALAAAVPDFALQQVAPVPVPPPTTLNPVPLPSSPVSSPSRLGRAPPPPQSSLSKGAQRPSTAALLPPPRLVRYPAKVFLSAFMIIGHPETVFSTRGRAADALAKAAAELIPVFEDLVKYILENHSAAMASPALPTPSPLSLADLASAAAFSPNSAAAPRRSTTVGVDSADATAPNLSVPGQDSGTATAAAGLQRKTGASTSTKLLDNQMSDSRVLPGNSSPLVMNANCSSCREAASTPLSCASRGPSHTSSPPVPPCLLESSSLPAPSPPSLPSTPKGTRPLNLYSPSKSLPNPSSAVSDTTTLSLSPSPSPISRSDALGEAEAVGANASNPQSGERRSFAAQLAAFDSAWVTYVERFVSWKAPDGKEMEEGMIATACELELSMLTKCKGKGLDAADLSPDIQAIRQQVQGDFARFQFAIFKITGEAGVARLEAALQDVRSRFAASLASSSPSLLPAQRLSPGAVRPSSSRTSPADLFPAPVAPSLHVTAAFPGGAPVPLATASPKITPGKQLEDGQEIRKASSRAGTPSQRLASVGSSSQKDRSEGGEPDGSPRRASIRRSLFRFPPVKPSSTASANSETSGGACTESAPSTGGRSPLKSSVAGKERKAGTLSSPSGPAAKSDGGNPAVGVKRVVEIGPVSIAKGGRRSKGEDSSASGVNEKAAHAGGDGVTASTPPKAKDSSRREGLAALSDEELLQEMLYDSAFRFSGSALVDGGIVGEGGRGGKVTGSQTSEDDGKQKTDKVATSLESSVRTIMEAAFWDGVAEDLLEGPVPGTRRKDPPRIIALIQEFRDDLVQLAPASFNDEIEDSLDMEVLTEMFATGGPTPSALLQLLQYSSDLMIRLGAPVRDAAAKKGHQKLLEELSAEAGTGAVADRGVLVWQTVKGLKFLFGQLEMLKADISRSKVNLLVAPVLQGPLGISSQAERFSQRFQLPLAAAATAEATQTLQALVAAAEVGGAISGAAKNSISSVSGSGSPSRTGSYLKEPLVPKQEAAAAAEAAGLGAATRPEAALGLGAELAEKLPKTATWLGEVLEKLPEFRGKLDPALAAVAAAAPQSAVPPIANLRTGLSNPGGQQAEGGAVGMHGPQGSTGTGPSYVIGQSISGTAVSIEWSHATAAVQLGCVLVSTRHSLPPEQQQAEGGLPETLRLDAKRIQKMQRDFQNVLLCATGLLLTRQTFSAKSVAPADVDAALASLKEKVCALIHESSQTVIHDGRDRDGSAADSGAPVPLLLHRVASLMAEEANAALVAPFSLQQQQDGKGSLCPYRAPNTNATLNPEQEPLAPSPSVSAAAPPPPPPDLQETMARLLLKEMTPRSAILGHLSTSIRLALASLVFLMPDVAPTSLLNPVPSAPSSQTRSAEGERELSSLPPLAHGVASTFLRRAGCAILFPEVLRLAQAIAAVAKVTSQVHKQWYLPLWQSVTRERHS